MKYATGNIYTGRWNNDLRSGKGHYKCVKGESWMEYFSRTYAHEYDGEWLNDKYHG
jgi:MORN repeat